MATRKMEAINTNSTQPKEVSKMTTAKTETNKTTSTTATLNTAPVTEFKFKPYKTTYEAFAEQLQAGIPKLGWELYDTKPLWRITDLNKVIDALYKMGDCALLTCAHVKTASYIKYHYGKAAAEVSEILKSVPITDRAGIEAKGLKVEHVLMVNAKKAREVLGDKYKDLFTFKSQTLARQVFTK